MNQMIEDIKGRVNKLAVTRKDLDMYRASEGRDTDAENAFDYLKRLIEEGGAADRKLAERCSKNKARYEQINAWIGEEERDGFPNGEVYVALYREERELILTYCYMSILLLLQEEDVLSEIVVRVESAGSESKVDISYRDSVERNAKRRATVCAKDITGIGSIDSDALTDEQIAEYDAAWNEKYGEEGGTDASALNPAARARDSRIRKAEKAARRAKEGESRE